MTHHMLSTYIYIYIYKTQGSRPGKENTEIRTKGVKSSMSFCFKMLLELFFHSNYLFTWKTLILYNIKNKTESYFFNTLITVRVPVNLGKIPTLDKNLDFFLTRHQSTLVAVATMLCHLLCPLVTPTAVDK